MGRVALFFIEWLLYPLVKVIPRPKRHCIFQVGLCIPPFFSNLPSIFCLRVDQLCTWQSIRVQFTASITYR